MVQFGSSIRAGRIVWPSTRRQVAWRVGRVSPGERLTTVGKLFWMVPAVEFFQFLYHLTVDLRGRVALRCGIGYNLKFFWMVLLVKFHQTVYHVLTDFRRGITPLAFLCHISSATLNPWPMTRSSRQDPVILS